MTMKAIRRIRGFSLVELLVVIAIILLVGAMSLSVTSSVLDSNNLTRAGQTVIDQINKARQLASARNRTVEVRLVKLPELSAVGYTGLEIVSFDATGAAVAVGRIVKLPDGTAISEAASLSPVIAGLPSGTRPANGLTGAGAEYRSFRIRPNGTVEPVPAAAQRSDFFFTVVKARQATESGAPPNYMSIQVNPDTGSTLAYRP